MDVDDRDLLKRYRAGEVAALEALVEKYRRPLFGFIVNMTGGQDDADDIFQETWYRAIRKLAGYRQGNLLGWLVRIARNLVIDRYRRRKPDVSLDAEDGAGRALGERIEDPGPGPAAQILTRDVAARVAAAVETLPAEQKEVFVLRVRANLSFKEIAKVQRVSINTALARMQYALAKLRPVLKEDYDELSSS